MERSDVAALKVRKEELQAQLLVVNRKLGDDRYDPLNVADWADRHRFFSSSHSAFPGSYRTWRVPYMRGIMDALSPESGARRIVIMKAGQMGATEVSINWLGHTIHMDPGPFAIIVPTKSFAKRLFEQRIEPFIEDSPIMRDRVSPGAVRGVLKFQNGLAWVGGANSAVDIISGGTIRKAWLDEVDSFPESLGEEGDPVPLVEKRMITFGHRAKLVVAGSPMGNPSRIAREFAQTDQRRYFVPCPHCKELQHLEFEQLRWAEGDPKSTVYECKACGRAIEEKHKPEMMSLDGRARWAHTAPATTFCEAEERRLVGFHLNALYQPIGWSQWSDLIAEFEKCKAGKDAHQVFRPLYLGLPNEEAV